MTINLRQMPLVSIITVSYNTGRFIEDNILSVKHQDYPLIEHIVVDGGSTDSTLDILRKYKTVRWISEPDKGVTDAFNKGISMASGDILAFQNSDDVYYSCDAVRKAVDAMMSNPTVGVIFGDFATIDADGRVVGFSKGGGGKQYNLPDLLCSEFTVPLVSAFIRGSAIEAIGGKLDASLDFAADWELWTWIGLKFPIMYVAERFGSVRKYPGEVKDSLRCALENPAKRRLVLDQVFRDPALSPEIRALQKRAYAGTYRNEALRLLSIGYKKEAMGRIFTAIRLYSPCILDQKLRSCFLKSVGGKLFAWAAALRHKAQKKEPRLEEFQCIRWWRSLQ